MEFIFISNQPKIGAHVISLGVSWVMVDLEKKGKDIRQKNMNSVKSNHCINDIVEMRKFLPKGKLLVRINPIGSHSPKEIELVLAAGADAIMLPYFKTVHEVKKILDLIHQRCKCFLLLETLSAIKNLNEILAQSGIDYIHFGLNDLNIERKTKFMFEFIADGSIDSAAEKIRNSMIPFGIGGIGQIGSLKPTPQSILLEHKRLGSIGVILSRSFINYQDYDCDIRFMMDFETQFEKIKEFLLTCDNINENDLLKNRSIFEKDVKKVVDCLIANGNMV